MISTSKHSLRPLCSLKRYRVSWGCKSFFVFFYSIVIISSFFRIGNMKPRFLDSVTLSEVNLIILPIIFVWAVLSFSQVLAWTFYCIGIIASSGWIVLFSHSNSLFCYYYVVSLHSSIIFNESLTNNYFFFFKNIFTKYKIYWKLWPTVAKLINWGKLHLYFQPRRKLF